MGHMIEFRRPDGGACRGYFASAGSEKPGVVVIQEWWGLNPQICGIAERLSVLGYNALAPDLYQGRVTQDPDEASHVMNGLDFPGATHEDIHGAIEHLRHIGNGRAATMGYCMGGALSIAAAVHIPGLTAAVCFYGIPPQDFADPALIDIPFQGHFANRDDWCTPAAVNELEVSMRERGQLPEIYRYDAAHAFCNEKRPEVYDAVCAGVAWDRMQDFLERHLS